MNRCLIIAVVLGGGLVSTAFGDPLDDILRPILSEKIRDRIDLDPVDPEPGDGTWADNMSDAGEFLGGGIFFTIDGGDISFSISGESRVPGDIVFHPIFTEPGTVNIITFPSEGSGVGSFVNGLDSRVDETKGFFDARVDDDVDEVRASLRQRFLREPFLLLPEVTIVDAASEIELAAEAATIESPAIVEGAFEFKGKGTAGKSYAVEKSTDLIGWTQIGRAESEAGAIQFCDEHASGARQAFYRIQEIE